MKKTPDIYPPSTEDKGSFMEKLPGISFVMSAVAEFQRHRRENEVAHMLEELANSRGDRLESVRTTRTIRSIGTVAL